MRVFSTESCPYCVALKAWLQENNIEFEAIDVGSNVEAQKEMIEATKQMGVPVSEIDGKWIVGFDKKQLGELLKI